MTSVITRSNTTNFAFSFLDNTGSAASVASATVQLVYLGRNQRETEVLTLAENVADSTWDITWASSKSRGGWVDYHAHAISDAGDDLTEDGRFKISSNEANLQHDALPQGSNSLTDYN